MAKIELRDCTIKIRDGLAGTAKAAASALAAATTLTVDTVAVNTQTPTVIPVGARFTVAGETGSPVHVVTTSTGTPTTSIDFTPALAANVSDETDITILPREIEVKVGDGNLTYTEAKEYTYELDRGDLDTVREGDAQPLAVNLQFVYEFVRTGTNNIITPVDALKGVGGAASWVSSSADACEPYAVDLIIEHEPECRGVGVQNEITTFPDFRHDQLQFDLSAASIAVTGRCNVTEATIQRVTPS